MIVLLGRATGTDAVLGTPRASSVPDATFALPEHMQRSTVVRSVPR